MGKAGGGVEKGSFSLSALSLFRFHLSPFPPETPDTQAKLEPQPRTAKKTIESLFLASACSKRRSDSGEQREEKLRRSLLEFDSMILSSPAPEKFASIYNQHCSILLAEFIMSTFHFC